MPQKKLLQDLDFLTPENIQYFMKLIFFKINKADRRWHICLPEMTSTSGFLSFCQTRAWAEIDTQNRQRLEQMMQQEHSEFCERCAEEFMIAYSELKRQGYLKF